MWGYSIVAFLVLAAIWLGFGVVAKGYFLAFSQANWPEIAEETYRQDVRRSNLVLLAGPAGLFALWVNGLTYGSHFRFGWRWR